MKNSTNTKMYLTAGKTIKTKLTPESPLVGPERIDVVINKADEACKCDQNTVVLVRNKAVRTTARIVTDEAGNDHLITTVPRENSATTAYNVLMRTKHGKLTEHQNSISMHFSFQKAELHTADTLEDEASEMADFICEQIK